MNASEMRILADCLYLAFERLDINVWLWVCDLRGLPDDYQPTRAEVNELRHYWRLYGPKEAVELEGCNETQT